jgi:hypothetical protein
MSTQRMSGVALNRMGVVRSCANSELNAFQSQRDLLVPAPPVGLRARMLLAMRDAKIHAIRAVKRGVVTCHFSPNIGHGHEFFGCRL